MEATNDGFNTSPETKRKEFIESVRRQIKEKELVQEIQRQLQNRRNTLQSLELVNKNLADAEKELCELNGL